MKRTKCCSFLVVHALARSRVLGGCSGSETELEGEVLRGSN